MGPEYLGSTASLTGNWKIVFRLHVLIKWGMTDYKAWFEEHILAWYKKRCSSRQDTVRAKASDLDSKDAAELS